MRRYLVLRADWLHGPASQVETTDGVFGLFLRWSRREASRINQQTVHGRHRPGAERTIEPAPQPVASLSQSEPSPMRERGWLSVSGKLWGGRLAVLPLHRWRPRAGGVRQAKGWARAPLRHSLSDVVSARCPLSALPEQEIRDLTVVSTPGIISLARPYRLWKLRPTRADRCRAIGYCKRANSAGFLVSCQWLPSPGS